MHVLVICKFKKDRIKNNREKVETSFSPLQVNGGFLLPWKPEFWANLPQNLMQPFPHPSNATHKIWSRLADWLQRYSSLKVWTTEDDGRRQTTTDDDDGWTTDDGPLVYYKLTLWAFGSGKLKIRVLEFQKVAKTGSIGKKVQWQAISIMKDTSPCRRLMTD